MEPCQPDALPTSPKDMWSLHPHSRWVFSDWEISSSSILLCNGPSNDGLWCFTRWNWVIQIYARKKMGDDLPSKKNATSVQKPMAWFLEKWDLPWWLLWGAFQIPISNPSIQFKGLLVLVFNTTSGNLHEIPPVWRTFGHDDPDPKVHPAWVWHRLLMWLSKLISAYNVLDTTTKRQLSACETQGPPQGL